MSMQVIDEDQYTPLVAYGAGSHTLTREKSGTRYVLVAIRTLVDPSDPKDVQQVHVLQDAIKVSQQAPGRFDVPDWDRTSQKKVRDALLALGFNSARFQRDVRNKEAQVDPVRRLVGAASAWGGNPEKEATYLNVTAPRNDGTTIYRLNVGNVPVDGFWSISVYNAEGYFQKNEYDAYTLNNITARKSDDGSVAIQFGGCDGKIANCLPTVPGLELPGTALSSARRNLEWPMGFSAGRAGGEWRLKGAALILHARRGACKNATIASENSARVHAREGISVWLLGNVLLRGATPPPTPWSRAACRDEG